MSLQVSVKQMALISKLSKRLRAKVGSWFHAFSQGSKISYLQEQLRQQQISNDFLMALWMEVLPQHPNPLGQFGRKVFSQTDEDGITEEILRRIGLVHGTCVEIGSGDGLENNTLSLLARGWQGVWLDARPLAFNPNCNPSILKNIREFVTAENVVELVRKGLDHFNQTGFDLLSIDVDGNDGYLAESILLAKYNPSVVIVEINEILPPPVRFQQPYNAKYVWDKTKNSGWSLQSVADLMERFGYDCVCCNPQTGVNAFFIHSRFRPLFPEVPTELSKIFVGRAAHPFKYKDHRTSVTAGLVESILVSSSRR